MRVEEWGTGQWDLGGREEDVAVAVVVVVVVVVADFRQAGFP